jgi:hypothetical protein
MAQYIEVPKAKFELGLQQYMSWGLATILLMQRPTAVGDSKELVLRQLDNHIQLASGGTSSSA